MPHSVSRTRSWRWARLLLAHVIACYAWVAIAFAYGAMTREAPATRVEPGFVDLDRDGVHDVPDEDDDPWFLQPGVLAVLAPVSVPCGLIIAVWLAVASPVERLPVSTCLIVLAMYGGPMVLACAAIGVRATTESSDGDQHAADV